MKVEHQATLICGALLGAIVLPTALAEGTPALSDVTRTLVEEMDRSVEQLRLPDAPELYHLRYHTVVRQVAETSAAYGAVLSTTDEPANALYVELRLGSSQYDNTGFVGGMNGFIQTELPAALTPDSLSLAAWRTTDLAYKAAVGRYAAKQAEYTQPPEHPGDYQLTGATQAEITNHSQVDAGLVQRLAVELSAAVPSSAGFERSEVRAYHQSGLFWTVDTEGSRVVRPTEEAGLRAVAYARCEDGSLLSDHRSWWGRSPADLPAQASMRAAIVQMSETLQALTTAPALDKEYVGPVVFEDGAAVDLFRYLLVPQVEGTPPEASSTGGRGIFGSGRGGSAGGVRLSRRVLPPGWSVVDDPTAHPQHVASFAYDDEGTPTQKVKLIVDGIVKDVLMSRVPRRGVQGTNGHARNSFSDRAQGRAMMMTITPDHHESERKIYKKAMRLAKAYDRDYVMVVRRLQDPPVRGYADFASRVSLLMGADGSASLPQPIYIVRRYADGHEEPVRGAEFANVQRFALRDIVAAGPQQEATYLAPLVAGSVQSGLTNGFPTWLSAPEVLIGELELVPTSGDPKDKSPIPAPK